MPAITINNESDMERLIALLGKYGYEKEKSSIQQLVWSRNLEARLTQTDSELMNPKNHIEHRESQGVIHALQCLVPKPDQKTGRTLLSVEKRVEKRQELQKHRKKRLIQKR